MRRQVCCWVIVVATISGCGSSNMHPVRGRVLLDEKPVEGATVTFMPVGGKGIPASSPTNAEGAFQLKSYKNDYIVVVTRTDAVPEPPQAEPGDTKSVKEHYKALKAKRPKSPPLPPIYADQAKSPFRVSVPTDGEVVLRLESKPR